MEGDARPAPAWEKLPKADLAALAQHEICRTPWLPPPLRQAAVSSSYERRRCWCRVALAAGVFFLRNTPTLLILILA